MSIFDTIFLYLYALWQYVLDKLMSPTPPAPQAKLIRPRIAIIGAGVTGVSSAAHCVGHGFDVTIFEAGSEDQLGGIWARVNNTSGLQIHSMLYRFFPSVRWKMEYPDRTTILAQVKTIWLQYGLGEKTRFNTRITSVRETVGGDGKNQWIINDDERPEELYDGIIVAVGTCGKPKMAHVEAQDKFHGEILHSSQLDGRTAKGKKVLIIGGGASAVEALEFVVNTGGTATTVLARSEKWIIPRNLLVNAFLSFNVFGQQTMFSCIPEWFLRKFFYRDLEDLAPVAGGLFTGTPMVNSDIFQQIRDGKASWLRGDVVRFTETGILFNRRQRGVRKGGPGVEQELEADMVIMATGFHRPSLNFLPAHFFKEPYAPPNWYLQVFSPENVSVCAANCTYVEAIGSVGYFHIGIYTRFLLMFLVDPLTRPNPYWMKTWIDFTRYVKSRAPTGAFDFFTYSELLYWFVFCLFIIPFRWKWTLFVLFGIGKSLPMSIVAREERVRDRFAKGALASREKSL